MPSNRLKPVLQAVALCLAALPAVSWATTFTDIWGVNGSNWGAIGMIAVTLSLLFAAVGFMLGKAFRQAKLEAWAKNEIYQAIASILIFVLLAGFFVFFSALTRDLASEYAACPAGGSSPHLDCVRVMLNETRGNLTTQANSLFNVNMRAKLLATYSSYSDISPNQETGQTPIPWPWIVPVHLAFGIKLNFYAGAGLISAALGIIFQPMFAWIASLIAQEFFMRMVQEALFPILLALGLILRTFFFTRKLGGLLLAIAVGVYTVYPLMYVLLAPAFVINPAQLWTDNFNPVTCLGDGPVRFCSLKLITMVLFFGLAPDTGVTPLDLDLNWLFTVANLVGRFAVPALLIPALIAYVTLAFIKGFSTFLGGDVEIAGLTHLL